MLKKYNLKANSGLILNRLLVLSFFSLFFVFISAGPKPQSNSGPACKNTYPANSNWEASFFDLIDGGTCWSCPKGHKRSVTSVKSATACIGNVKATYHGKYSCKGKYGDAAFKDLIDGGTCWTCPSGYVRTVAGVKTSKACAKKLVVGPFAAATLKGKPECDKGFKDIIDGGTCWSCPSGSKRTASSVKSDQACASSTYAQSNGKYMGFRKMSDAGKQKVKSVANGFASKNEQVLTEANKIFKLLNGKYKNVLTLQEFKSAIQNGTYQNLWAKVKNDVTPILRTINSAQGTARGNFNSLKVLSISFTSSGSAIVGLGIEQGILINFSNVDNVIIEGFVSHGVSVGSSAGIGSGISVGIWRANKVDCGAIFNATVGVGIGKTAQVGGSIGIDPYFACKQDWEALISLDYITGMSIGASAGIGAPIPVNVEASTSSVIKYNGKFNPVCSPCGGLNQAACSLTQRVPSCNKGYKENCGKCVAI